MSFRAKGGLRYKAFVENCCGGKWDVAAMKLQEYAELPKEDSCHFDVMEDFSLAELAEECRRPEFYGPLVALKDGQLSEAVNVSDFTKITDALISTHVKKTWQAYPKQIDKISTKFTSKQQTDTIPYLQLQAALADVHPGQDYGHTAGMSEYYVTVGHQKRGLILDVTEEAVRFDQTGLVMKTAGDMAEAMALDREKHGFYTFMDATVSGKNYYGYYPQGTRTAVWNDAVTTSKAHYYDNKIVDVLTDYTDLEAAMKLLALMCDNDGNPISVMANQVVVPNALLVTARRIINNIMIATPASGASFAYNERNPYADAFEIVSTPLIDTSGVTAATTNWWLGDFKSMFYEKVVIPFEVKSRNSSDGNEDGWNRDIFHQVKVRYDSKFFFDDYRYAIYSAGTG